MGTDFKIIETPNTENFSVVLTKRLYELLREVIMFARDNGVSESGIWDESTFDLYNQLLSLFES